jgi:S-adenosylmethionine hydrolase
VTVEILDQFNNVLTNDNSDTITVARSDGGTLNGTLTQMVNSGVATFGDLSINQAGTGYTLNANSTGIGQITSNAFAITAAAAHHLLFLQQPTDTSAGQTMSPVVIEVVDQFGNVVTNYSGAVTLSLNDNPMTGATLSGTLTVTVVNGVATFNDLSIDLAGTGYSLHATIGGGLPDLDSNPFNIT